MKLFGEDDLISREHSWSLARSLPAAPGFQKNRSP